MTNVEQTAWRWVPYVTLFGVVLANMSASLLVKVGSTTPASKAVFFGVFGWQTALGIGLFGISLLLYIWSLRFIPLFVVQSFAALQFVAVILAAHFILGEVISLRHWMGICLIAIGVIVVVR